LVLAGVDCPNACISGCLPQHGVKRPSVQRAGHRTAEELIVVELRVRTVPAVKQPATLNTNCEAVESVVLKLAARRRVKNFKWATLPRRAYEL